MKKLPDCTLRPVAEAILRFAVTECKDHKPMAYRCKDCRKHFSVRTGTVFTESQLPLQKWLLAIFMMTSARKGIPSTQVARVLTSPRDYTVFIFPPNARHNRKGRFRVHLSLLEKMMGSWVLANRSFDQYAENGQKELTLLAGHRVAIQTVANEISPTPVRKCI